MDSNTPGIYQIIYTKTDAAGNVADPVVRTINVVDSDAPVITLLGDANITHEAGSVYTDAGAQWNDSVDGNGTADANGTVDSQVPGTYQIHYTFTDSSGNAAEPAIRTIQVVDTTPPVIAILGISMSPTQHPPLMLIREQTGQTLSMGTDRQMPMDRWIPTHLAFTRSFTPRPMPQVMLQIRWSEPLMWWTVMLR